MLIEVLPAPLLVAAITILGQLQITNPAPLLRSNAAAGFELCGRA
jgi:hypothetical protein